MWINTARKRNDDIYVSKFEDYEEDFIPYINHLRKVALYIKEKENRLMFLDIVDNLYERSNDVYLKQNKEFILSYLTLEELAEFTVHLSYLLLEVKEKE